MYGEETDLQLLEIVADWQTVHRQCRHTGTVEPVVIVVVFARTLCSEGEFIALVGVESVDGEGRGVEGLVPAVPYHGEAFGSV